MIFHKIEKKILGIKYNLDILQQVDGILTIKGWVFSTKGILKNVYFTIEDEDSKKTDIRGKYKIKRADVYQEFHLQNAQKSGFYAQILVENVKKYSVWLVFSLNGKVHKLFLGKKENKEKINPSLPPRITEIDTNDQGIDIAMLLKKQKEYKLTIPQQLYSETIDIIIPIYNGYQFLEKLFPSVGLTKMNYRLILINDKSPDPKVAEFLKEFAHDKDNVILLENEENLGFVKTVNRGFEISENHVALVNTDVELPKLWLERLMLPILENPKIASSTPYTTCGTICSFPDMGKDNKLFLGLNVQEIDDEFIKIPPKYAEMPTGVGFCMGINKNALHEVGRFDAESFGKGYGEENDWCQRAIDKGYKNVQVENLFVFHNHGGSFLSEDKKRFLEEHEKILLKKHPYYNRDVAKYFTLDPNREIREFVKLNLLRKCRELKTILAFDHNLGGGAAKYLIGKKDYYVKNGRAFVIFRFDFNKESYIINFYSQDCNLKLHIKKRSDWIEVAEYLDVNEIWINELVTYPDLYLMLDEIRDFSKKNNVPVKMLIHDYFCVCPTINLLNDREVYCGVPEYKECNECLKRVKSLQSLEYESMERWRKEWGEFMRCCCEVIVFSEDSKNIIEKVFGTLDNILVIPHQIEYLPKVEKKYKTTKTLNIGLLGVLTKHKGRSLVTQMVRIIEREKLNVRIILIGSSSKEIKSEAFRQTGAYTRDSIPRLILENDIDIFLIPSIWPETFSYTTEEIMTIGFPIMCFDIGAPAERVKKYEKGIIIPEISAEAVLKTVRNNAVAAILSREKYSKKRILFVVEDITFSSRYRVDHLREQLLQKGVASDCVKQEEVLNYNLERYLGVIVYRSSQVEIIRKLVDKAHRAGKNVYYDMDDYIFDYPEIKDLKFLEGEDYVGFAEYSGNICQTMKLCDGYIVSTFNLKNAVEKSFPGKKVIINRNVASMEMMILSLCTKKEESDGEIRLGYFSGSKTHNEDFESIKDVILSIMDKNKQVCLMIGGQIELPKEFNTISDRIEKFDFVSWKKLPQLIAKADINLMPLENTFFHACKSENKWMEAAFVHVPTVATWNTELETAIEDGVTGYLCKNSSDWETKLQKLIDEEPLRTKIAENANRKVMQNYTTYNLEAEVLELFSE